MEGMLVSRDEPLGLETVLLWREVGRLHMFSACWLQAPPTRSSLGSPGLESLCLPWLGLLRPFLLGKTRF